MVMKRSEVVYGGPALASSLVPPYAPAMSDRPAYDRGDRAMLRERAPRAASFARLIVETSAPFLPAAVEELSVLDVGCGYGHTALELARRCGSAIGIEPSAALYEHAEGLRRESARQNLEFRRQSVYDLDDRECYDLIVLDNVLEHLDDQPRALARMERALKPGGLLFIIVPNRLWPIEVHYRLPFLSYLPLAWANRYLRLTGRGEDYTDASFAPTYWGLRRLLRGQHDLRHHFVPPCDVSLATLGHTRRYAVGVAAIRRFPWLWAISKVFLVIAVKR